MNKLFVGYEEYDPQTKKGWNYNGRIANKQRKSLSPKDSNNTFYQDLYQVLCDPQKFEKSHDLRRPLFSTNYGKCHTNLSLDNISNSLKYIYPIFIHSLHFFVNYIDEIEISDRVRNDVNQGKAYIVFIYTAEGDMRLLMTEFSTIINRLNLPKKQIIVFHGDLDLDFFKEANFTYVPMCVFPYWIRQYKNIAPVTYQPNKLFLALNRTIRPHKQFMLASLIKHNLLDDGLYSCGNLLPNLHGLTHFALTEEQKQKLHSLQLTSPDDIVVDNQLLNKPNEINFDLHTQTFLSLITETLVDGIFFSEKTFKPIAIGHPFIILAAPNHLAFLKKFGYKTFDEFWDESYDKEIDLIKRIEKISQILKNLQKLSTEQLVNLRSQMQDILDYNRSVFSDSIKEVNNYVDQVDIRDYLLKLLYS